MYIVEGTIGAGKSTFLKLAQNHMPSLHVCQEPLHAWEHAEHDQSLLALFYQDPYRWGYTLETVTMLSRVRDHLRQQTIAHEYALMERSIYSGYYCFAKNGYLQGSLSSLEWEMYSAWFTTLVQRSGMVPQGFIYLKVSPQVAFERMIKRNRSAENSMSRAYLEQLDERHTEFLLQKKDLLPELAKVPVLVLDCDKDFEEDETHLRQLLEALRLFVKN